MLIEIDIISVRINNKIEYSVLTDNRLIENKVGRKVNCVVGIEDIQPYIHRHPMVSYALKKLCACHIVKMYDLVCAACRFFNLLKVDMFLNRIDIKPAQAAADNSLLYTPEGEVSSESHGLPQKNHSSILLNKEYPMNCY